MMRSVLLCTGLCILLYSLPTYSQTQATSGYIGQTPPGSSPVVFAPGLVSTPDETEFGSVFSKDGDVFYYAVDIDNRAEIRTIRFEHNAWTKSELFLSDEVYSYNDPFLSPDEKRLYFISDRPINKTGTKKDFDIWYVEKNSKGWSDPMNAGNNINSSGNEYYVSFTREGTMYFSSNGSATDNDKNDYDIYTSRQVLGKFQTRVKLSDGVNTPHYEADVFVSPDESYLIFSTERPGGFGRGDLYISFHNKGIWSEPKNMGNTINGGRSEYCPFVTADGKYFFYTSMGQIFWVDAGVIHGLK